MRIYTVYKDSVSEGARVTTVTLTQDVIIPAIAVGESGRGRQRSYIPLKLLDNNNLDDYVVKNVAVGFTKSGRTKFFEIDEDSDSDIIIIDTNDHGFRGGNVRHIIDDNGTELEFGNIDGKITILAVGISADGMAGRMASSSQIIFKVTPPLTYKVSYTGRMYGQERDYYYIITEKGITAIAGRENFENYMDLAE